MANDRITQLPVEVAIKSDMPARFTQTAVEIAIDPDPQMRMTQVVIEVAVQNTLRPRAYVMLVD